MTPESWPEGELEKYWRLQRTYSQPQPPGEGAHGLVAVTSDVFAARAGLEALRRGGGAVDAALSTAFAQIVLTAGSTTSFAGILTMVYYDAAGKKIHSLNAGFNTAREENDPLGIPGRGEPNGRATLVPGFFAGAQAAHDRFGKLPFADLFDPALYLAEKGFVIDPALGARLHSQKNVLGRLPDTKRIFTKGAGEFYVAGDHFTQPRLAETLRKVAAYGADYVYRGEWAKKFVATIRGEGGKLTREDMESYRAIWSDPAQTEYHGHQVYSLGLPGLGGGNTIEALNLLEAADLERYGHYTTSPDALYEFIQICRAALYLSFFPQELIKHYAPELDVSPAARVRKDNARALWRSMNEPGWRKMLALTLPQVGGSSHSAGVVAADPHGDVAALVHTINTVHWGASGVFVDGVSIPDSASFQQRQIAKLKPGDRLPEQTNPVIVLKGGRAYLGSAGIGAGLHATTMNNLVNTLDFGMDPKQSIETPNFLGPFFGMGVGDAPRWDQEALAEGDFANEMIEALKTRGQAVRLLSKREALAQRGHWVAVKIDPKTGNRTGAAPIWLNGGVAGF
jgi:gamma-glutamyltranspeptidase/glutathione hydrolase